MLSTRQIKFRDNFLSPFKQKVYYLKSLPIGLLSGIRLIHLDENRSVSEAPFRWINKNPFDSMYFAVQSMAAELSTAAPVILSLKCIDLNVALIIIELKVDFMKRARSKVVFTCQDYEAINTAVTGLKQPGDTATVTAKSVGRDMSDDEVATFFSPGHLR